MSEHTPTPFTKPFVYQEESDDYTHIVRDATGRYVCGFPQYTDGSSEAVAREFVRACNCHDELVKALKRAVYLLKATQRMIQENNLEEYTAEWDETTCDGSCLCDDAQSSIEEGEAALAKAEGKS